MTKGYWGWQAKTFTQPEDQLESPKSKRVRIVDKGWGHVQR